MQAAQSSRFSWLLITLHWVVLLLVIGVYATIELHDAFPKGSAGRAALTSWHSMLGVSVLGLAAVRLLVRAFSPAPAIDPAPPRWQATAATLTHIALYALMFVLPLTGWLMFNADGKELMWFGAQLPTLVAPSKPLAHTIKEVHEVLANLGYGLIGLHAAAALFHHYVMRDNTLQLMWPRLRPVR
ncbi:MAG TPA: cytochrome b [Burkholderiaceae bacterium]|nr:cytochrome b [Burkholderiaceae bacterium]HQR71076.1 cytochrome b [Burkholderiaceae bacterium]